MRIDSVVIGGLSEALPTDGSTRDWGGVGIGGGFTTTFDTIAVRRGGGGTIASRLDTSAGGAIGAGTTSGDTVWESALVEAARSDVPNDGVVGWTVVGGDTAGTEAAGTETVDTVGGDRGAGLGVATAAGSRNSKGGFRGKSAVGCRASSRASFARAEASGGGVGAAMGGRLDSFGAARGGLVSRGVPVPSAIAAKKASLAWGSTGMAAAIVAAGRGAGRV